MCRITKKADGSNGRDYVPLSSFGYVIDQDAVNKLGRLEDFEESVGKGFEEYLKENALYQHCKRLEEKLLLLERENKALDEEGVAKCELNEILKKQIKELEEKHKESIELFQKNIFRLNDALNKACDLLCEAVKQDYSIFDEVIEENYSWRT